jgi:hypothetical protein
MSRARDRSCAWRHQAVPRPPYGSHIGTLAVGKAADLVLIDWDKLAYPNLDPETPVLDAVLRQDRRCRPRHGGGPRVTERVQLLAPHFPVAANWFPSNRPVK